MNSITEPPITVHRLDDVTEHRWDLFVDSCQDSTFFHRAGWRRVIEESFGHRCYFLYAEVGGTIRGVLPLVHLDSLLFGTALISNAFCVYGGSAATDDRVRDALDTAAVELSRSLGVGHLEYRLRSPAHPDWACNSQLYVTFRKPLDADPKRNLSAVPRKQRAMVRKGIKFALTSEIDSNVDRFYPIYAESVRNLGTPVFSKEFFHNLKAVFRKDCEIVTVLHEDRPLTSVINFYFRDEVLPYYGGGTPAARGVAAFDFMYWEIMRRACERGVKIFDFGRSKRGTGSFSFKKHWGFEPQSLYYEYKLLRRNRIPEVNPLNAKYQLYIAAWKRLPLGVANLVGPYLARQLG